MTQFSLLRALDRLGSANITKLSDEVRLERTTLGRNLRILERSKLVAFASGEDLRDREVALTSSGKRALERAIPLWQNAQNQMRRWLGSRNLEQLTAFLAMMESKAA